MIPGAPSPQDERVTATVEFLQQVYGKGFQNEENLRTYLFTKRGLTKHEIDEAFRIHQAKVDKQGPGKPMGNLLWEGKHEEMLKNVEQPPGLENLSQIQAAKSLSFLMREKRAEGENIFLKFLQNEKKYFTKLECLHFEYYLPLVRMANEKQIKITNQELDVIFTHIPNLLKFHKNTFYSYLSQGKDIATTFLQFLKIFLGYVTYMRDCSSSVLKLRMYIGDSRFQKTLKKVKLRSKCKSEDFLDLLLSPINRIIDYRKFLDRLVKHSDTGKVTAYNLITKAARRIGRVATYISKYKDHIFNKVGMNKAQEFLGKQCDILRPNRRIVRRGVMIRHSTRWVARKKWEIFFLFNDLLLWTTKTGELQSVVRLVNCEIFNSDSKQRATRKFKLLCNTGIKTKVLELECPTDEQRRDWFKALNKTISMVKNNDKLDEVVLAKKWENTGESTGNNDIPPVLEVAKHIRNNSSMGHSGEIRLEDLFNNPESPSYSGLDDQYEISYRLQSIRDDEFKPMEEFSVSELDLNVFPYDNAIEVPSPESLNQYWEKAGSSESGDSRSECKIQRASQMNKKVDKLMSIIECKKETEEDDNSSYSSPLNATPRGDNKRRNSCIIRPLNATPRGDNKRRNSCIIRRPNPVEKTKNLRVSMSKLEDMSNFKIVRR